MDGLTIVAGAVVVLAVAQDVFATVLFPASRHGVIRKPVSASVWRAFRLVGRTTKGERRRKLLSYGGPAVITVAIAVWFVLLVLGWAMVYKPGLGSSITASSGATDSGWGTALYFSGFNLTTLGVGDVAARTSGYRLLTVAEAAMGFGVLSMVITYFLSVYSNLSHRNAFAQGLHHQSCSTGDAAEILAGFAIDGEAADLRGHLSSLAASLRQIHQSHRFYPVLRYFHYREPFYALPRILLLVLDAAALARTAMDQHRYRHVTSSRALDELERAAMTLLHELVGGIGRRGPDDEEVRRWRSRHDGALVRLARAGVEVPSDDGSGADDYVAIRTRWDGDLRRLADDMLYDWDVIEAPRT